MTTPKQLILAADAREELIKLIENDDESGILGMKFTPMEMERDNDSGCAHTFKLNDTVYQIYKQFNSWDNGFEPQWDFYKSDVDDMVAVKQVEVVVKQWVPLDENS